MAAQKPSIPKGTRDFTPQEMVRRNYIFDTIRAVFRRYGYLPIETPAMETIETLTGKYGDEGDQLLFKILNSRPHEARDENQKVKMREAFERTLEQNTNTPVLTEKALRYDLTVPFARFVVQHQHEITFPFRRYQIQPVWRADRPQKGRYREFYQCDADVIGSNSLLNEVELVQMIDDAFTTFDVPVTVKINNRKILSGIAEVIGEKERIVTITVAIDKLDKIGIEGVNKELGENGVSASAIEKLQPLIAFTGDYAAKRELLRNMLAGSEVGQKGIEEVDFIFAKVAEAGLQSATVELDITLARGLNYYTGAIFEVKANVGSLSSSICGGGRYDDLTGIFGLKDMSGVGISFGADRIYDVLNELNRYPADVTMSTQLLFINFGDEDGNEAFRTLHKVRRAGIAAEIYPDAAKIQKQFKYADARQIPFVAVIGESERTAGKVMLKNMQSGEQELVALDELINRLT
ncbi:MAG: histidine--tRNA ligase [Bacteroidia bacterium]|jgi:histidyl-tRNA synthetase|nr:histidine--tRNA ligase [Bacteroidia bacterium]